LISSFYKNLHDKMRTSSALFYIHYSENYSYEDCYRSMQKINSALHAIKDKPIALYVSKNFHAYCGIFSIILSGNIWVPFTPQHPSGRNLEMMISVGPEIIIADDKLPVIIEEYAEENSIPIYYLRDLVESPEAKEFEELNFSKDDVAYIMFTSGSTGTPKGVPMTHENYINFVNNALEILPFEKGEVFSDYHDFAFDISIFYLFCAVLTESAFAPIRTFEEKLFPLNNAIENKVTVWSSVPSMVSNIQKLRPEDKILNSIKIMFICGEPFRLDVLKYCYENLDARHVFNFYGLTETGVENFYHLCQYDDLNRFENKGFVPIGKPLKGNQIRISEENELLLSGCQITTGYLGGVGQERFEMIDGNRWFHTGDIVELIEDVYFCKGRMDSQIKLGGYRIELMDIEANLRRYVDIRDAVCFMEEADNRKTLVGALEASSVDIEKLKSLLKKVLPGYMIPQKFICLHEFPRNKNDKIDRVKIQNIYNKS
jgi:D-alanine--poly(phosphoribitol) ligase subunit 1